MRLNEDNITEGKAIHIAALMAMGLGIPTIAKMLKVPESQVRHANLAPPNEKAADQIADITVAAHPDLASLSVNDHMQFIEPHEGRRNVAYRDTVGIPTVGVGFNLNREDAPALLASVDADLARVVAGTPLTNEQINSLFRHDVTSAMRVAANSVNGFQSLPAPVQQVLVDMAFNLGPTRLRGFRNMLDAINHRDYGRAADEMVNSRWYSQVGNRSRELETMMRAAR